MELRNFILVIYFPLTHKNYINDSFINKTTDTSAEMCASRVGGRCSVLI
jgi:hypothetical protein